ncbi:glycoside hydrolase family 3 N-terminal domain-containing protein [Nocardioides campestrisoli]|uniref:glycoside hydrolase family 3 N-terminal domain-containing protein n=1 Tax=Nocardioides campestrisoli TaxID=2736757 RepID=UPI00281103B7|nr:glycoside hydrolase family 3 N-terminal domain-containing protein [Nocardioides campestrisoli]
MIGSLRSMAVTVGLAVALTGCGLVGDRGGSGDAAPATSTRDRGTASSGPGEARTDEPLPWGPTVAELEQARALVSGWTPEQLAGQVIVGRYHSTDPQVAAEMVSDLHLAGVSVTSGNVLDADQVRATTRAVTEAHAASGRTFPPVIGVDEEGGSVAHLRGIASTFPAFRAAGDVIDEDRATSGRQGRALVRKAYRASGLELRSFGFTWVFAPVADVTIGTADPTIGSRSPSSDPRTAGIASAAAVRGYNASGIVSTTKHYPGHGSATADSHLELPTLDTPLAELTARDLLPFKTSIRAGAPSVMMSHLEVTALEAGLPATLAPRVYAHLRDEMGFGGVAITDSLGMGAVAELELPAVRALEAGADLLLMPVDTRRTHAHVVEAIKEGRLSRERVEDAASRVVALQQWQQRTAGEVEVPIDATEQAQAAASELEAAAW